MFLPTWLAFTFGSAPTIGAKLLQRRLQPKTAKSTVNRLWAFRAPVDNAKVVEGWGRPRAYRNGVHEGLDFPVPVGTPVKAVADGVVGKVDLSKTTYGGIWVGLHHANGIGTTYSHLSKVFVHKGQAVKKGQTIALSGRTGKGGNIQSASHLHMTVRVQEPYLPFYEKAFGRPSSGYPGSKTTFGRAVPGEPLVPAQYPATVVRYAHSKGVVVYGERPLLGYTLVAGRPVIVS